MFEFNRKIAKSIDNARTEPKNVSKTILNNFQDKFNGTQMFAYGKIIDTFEGLQAVKDLQLYMRQKLAINPLIHSKTLDRAAQSIADQKGREGSAQNEKPKIIYEKIQSFGKVNGKIGNLISLSASFPEEIATYFLIDDGLASRKRRRMLLDPIYKYIGVGHAAHKQHEYITVILLVQNLEQNDNYVLDNQRIGEQLKMNNESVINDHNNNRGSSVRESSFY